MAMAFSPPSWLKFYASTLLILFFSRHFVRSSVENSGDALALISFKSLITHDPDGALASWGNTSLHYCNWLGVTCSNHNGHEPNRVIALELKAIDLAGSLSPSLGNLTFLQSLHISQTQISGTIPYEVGSLSNLQNLNLGHNLLSGEIPHTISQCSLLQNISLRGNMLHGEIPSNLSLCYGLQIIDFKSNNLNGIIPTSLGALRDLKMLFLRKNKLEAREEGDWAFLTALTNCSSLQYLLLGKNRLTGLLPTSVTNLSVHLKLLDMSDNQIYGGIPLGIEKLVNLQKIYLNNNFLNGIIPRSIGELPMLEILSLSSNHFSGEIPPSLGNLSSLSELYLDTNHLKGGIPPCLGNLTSLTFLGLSENNLTREIPSSLGHLLNLNKLYLSFNNLYGKLPPSLGSLKSLVTLNLGSNNLNGFIPDPIWNITSLIDLFMDSNNLIGSLPMNIVTLPSLQNLALSTNQFHGPIPTSLFNSSALELLQLEENLFSGSIHTNIGNLKGLTKVLLNNNNLEARDNSDWSFIASLTNCTNLNILDLTFNKLAGILPHSIVNLTTMLNVMYLGWNNISGCIPIEIGNLLGLGLLNLGPNNLTGTIPTTIGKLKSLQYLDLGNNMFFGEIPYSLGNLSFLSQLYLDHNNFNWHIPFSLGSCKQLTIMNLQNNKLIGHIPKEILSITTLSIGLSFSNNLLIGPLPIEIGHLVNLVDLDVSNNKFVGQIPSNLGECVQLKHLYMDRNLFQGIIPSSLKAIRSLELFDLSYNNLSGKIPEFLESFHSLQYVDLSYNHFEGEVPTNGVFLNTSEFSVYGNDKLCGGIVELKLPPCPKNKASRKKHNLAILLATIIPITCIILLIMLFFILLALRRQKSKKLPLIERLVEDQNHVKVSYAELRRATNGFSSHNLIGRGSFGSIYMGNMAHHWQNIIAVKVLNLQQRGASKSFEAECKALRNVRHRNLVRILTSCSSIDHEGNDFKALVFDFMPNGNLDNWLHQQSITDNGNRKNLTIIQRMNIALDVASALEYLHHHGPMPIVHCDLKPSNVLLDEDMVAHVGDFGLARLLSKTTTQFSQTSTSSVALKGTIGYAAPEYGVANQLSVEGDMYSYGIVLLEMFTGRRPTDEIFKEGLSLHEFVNVALPDRAMDILDHYLLLQEEGEEVGEGLHYMNNISRHELECIVSVLKVGLLCSMESPTERMQITQAYNELYTIKNTFLKSANSTTIYL